ncbi:MAG: ATP-binding protein [Bryobacteraceae bacterium]
MLCSFEVAMLLCSLILLKRGAIRKASLVYLSATWVVATVLTALNGGIRSPGLVFYIALPISAAWLLGFGATLWVTGLCLVTSLAMALLEIAGRPLPRFFPGTPASIWFTILFPTIISTVPVAHVLRILNEALERSQRDEEALRREHGLLTRIMETSPAAIVTLDKAGEPQFANANAEKTFGVSDDAHFRQAYNRQSRAVFDSSGRRLPYHETATAQVIATGRQVYGAQYWIERSDGKRILISTNAAPLLNSAGELEGVVAAVEDITERRRAEEELQKHKEHLQELVEQRTSELIVARDEAQAANRAKSAFLAKMSHELRTPLSAILGFSSLLGTERNLTDRQRGDLDIINRSGAYLLELINDLLDVFKIEAGRTVVENAPVDLLNLVREVMVLMGVRAREKGLNLSFKTSSDVPKYIRSDSAKLRQVLVNLVGNAIKYTEKGSVGIKVNAEKRAGDGGVLLMIDVEDTGIGIAAEDQVRIFDPFVQGGNSKTSSGTGLGLSITRQFLHLMGGAITSESMPSVGSVFRLRLPVLLSEESEVVNRSRGSERVTKVAPGEPEYRILVVEDESAHAFLLQRLLTAAGFRVLLASNGAEGIEAFREWKPHFVWMDRQMPVMDGLEAVRRIRAMGGGSHAKIAAVSASVLPEEREEVLAAGFDDFVTKPFTAEAIFSCMGRHLGAKYLFEESPGSPANCTGPLNPEALAAIPEELRDQLESALVRLDVQRISRVIDRISETVPALGGLLAEHASRYAFTSMLRALQGGRGKPALQE